MTKLIQESTLTAIGDAIRAKTGDTALMSPAAMVTAIEGISGGGSGGEIVNTDVEDALITRTITEYSNDRVTALGGHALRNCQNLITADFPNVAVVGEYAFAECYALKSVNIPLAESIGQIAFRYCRAIRKLDLPKVTFIDEYAFRYMRLLTALILRSETMVTLANSNAFEGCCHINGTTMPEYNPNGDKDGYIYVPSALVDEYKANSIWSGYSSQIRAIEDYPDITS